MGKIFVVVAVLTLLPSAVFASKTPDEAKKERIVSKTYRMQIPFIENRGQMAEDVSFYAKTFGGTLFVGKNGTLTYSLPLEDKGGVTIKEILTDNRVVVKGLHLAPTKANHFKGKVKSNWRSNIPSYDSISLGEIYKGVELILKAYGNNVEKLYTVLPNANPQAIKIELKGVKDLKINQSGELEVITELGPVAFTKPYAYQEIDGKRVEVEVSYKIQGTGCGVQGAGERNQKAEDLNAKCQNPNDKQHGDPNVKGQNQNDKQLTNPNSKIKNQKFRSPQSTIHNPKCEHPASPVLNPTSQIAHPTSLSYSFKIGDYNKSYPLIIDPLLASTFIGGGGWETGRALILDEISSNVYLIGSTNSVDYPANEGPYGPGGNIDISVSKLNGDLTTLLASTIIGGSSDDTVGSIYLDGSGNVYITGYTESSDYPTTGGAYDESFNGGGDPARDAFVSKLNSDLSTLSASTYLGGTNDADFAYSIIHDGGNVYVSGYTSSSDFPNTTTYGPGGTADVFIAKLSDDLTAPLVACILIGGSLTDYGGSTLELDGAGDIFITGHTFSTDFPATGGAYDQIHNGGGDAFASRFTMSDLTHVASTFLGGSSDDMGQSLAYDGSSIFVTGLTRSSDFPTTTGAYDEDLNGLIDVYVFKLSHDLSTRQACTFIGEVIESSAPSIAVDEIGNVYVAGTTGSYGFPATGGAYNESFNGATDIFVSKLSNDLEKLDASTFVGSTQDEKTQNSHGRNLAFVATTMGPVVYVVGRTGSPSFPIIPGAYDESYNGGVDVIVFALDGYLSSGLVPDTGQSKCYDDTEEITCPDPGGSFYGQDAHFNTNQQSYTKLDANGDELPDAAPWPWAMVRDNVTGLIWEVKTDDATIHDKDNAYTWYDGVTGTPGDGTDTLDFINGLNSAEFGGFNDWHLPTVKELSFLVNRNTSSPCINTDYFPNTRTSSSDYWSSTTDATYATRAWQVNFQLGYVTAPQKSAYQYVRAVRGGSFSNNFVDYTNGTVTDTHTGLMWEQKTNDGSIRDKDNTYTWEEALAYCEDLILNNDGEWTSGTPNGSGAKYDDWRLPETNELQSIVDYGEYNPSTDTIFFPNVVSSNYWSSTTANHSPGDGYFVNFDNSLIFYDGKSDSNYVRAVREGVDIEADGVHDSQDNCLYASNGPDEGTCVMDVSGVMVSYRVGDPPAPVTCVDDSDCLATGGFCQTYQGDYNGNGIGDACEGYADFDGTGEVNLADLLELILCYGTTDLDTYPECLDYDINEDERVSAWDFLILLLQYGGDDFE